MINIALIGAGYWGSKVAESLKQNSQVGKLQLIDIRNGDTINSIDCDVSAAIIATPLWDHYATAQALLERGINCYIEKPMAETADECREIAKFSKKCTIMVGHIFMYHPALDYIKQNINRIGTVKHVLSERLNWGIYQTKTTPLLSLLPHDVSILLELFGDQLEVTNVQSTTFTDNAVPDWVSFDGQMGDVTVRVTGTWYWPERVRKLTIIGSNGHIVWDDAANKVMIYTGAVVDRRLSALELVETHVPDLTCTPLQRELDHFIDCVVNKKQPKTDVANAIAVATVLDTVKLGLRSV